MKYKVAFICVHNSCRSQMAEAWMRELGSDVFDAYSAGSEKYHEVKPLAVKVMEDAKIDISSYYPKLISEIPSSVDVLISMGCNVQCPYIPCDLKEDWGIEDPSGGSIEDYKKCSDLIKEKVINLINIYKVK